MGNFWRCVETMNGFYDGTNILIFNEYDIVLYISTISHIPALLKKLITFWIRVHCPLVMIEFKTNDIQNQFLFRLGFHFPISLVISLGLKSRIVDHVSTVNAFLY